MLFFDIETNNLLQTLTKIHCLSILDSETNKVDLYGPGQVQNGLTRLSEAENICGHNVIAFDIPAIQKFHPWFVPRKVIDTLVLSRLVFGNLVDTDEELVTAQKLERQYRGKHSLKAWGHRLGILKGDTPESWGEYTLEMGAYCMQDAVVTQALFNKIKDASPTPESMELEHNVQWIIQRQIRRGVYFDSQEAMALYNKLQIRQEELKEELNEAFGAIYVATEAFTPAADNKRLGYTGGCPFTKVELQEFNPSSRQQVAMRLTQKYGWTPRKDQLTPTGQPRIDEDVLKDLDYPEAELLLEFLLVGKRMSQISDGDSGWLKHVDSRSRIHGEVNTGGAVTGRMTHSSPNLAQVPSNKSKYGKECRALFTATPGYELVGCDADALELRCLAHYMYRWDNGDYAKAVDQGDKDKGTDVHTLNQRAAGLETRDQAKTMIYGFLYGSGDAKLGQIIGGSTAQGKLMKQRLGDKVPALIQLKDAVTERAEERGFLIGLDGRKLHVRSAHAALNTLLQSAGALLMKHALVHLDHELQTFGLKPGSHYEFVLNIHDEFQIECFKHFFKGVYIPDHVAEKAKEAIREAGKFFNFKCPVSGSSAKGNNWAETH